MNNIFWENKNKETIYHLVAPQYLELQSGGVTVVTHDFLTHITVKDDEDKDVFIKKPFCSLRPMGLYSIELENEIFLPSNIGPLRKIQTFVYETNNIFLIYAVSHLYYHIISNDIKKIYKTVYRIHKNLEREYYNDLPERNKRIIINRHQQIVEVLKKQFISKNAIT